MLYRELADYYERLEKTPKKLEKAEILSEMYSRSGNALSKVVLLSMGTVYSQPGYDLGIASEMMKKSIARSYGVSGKEVDKKFKETGDLGTAAQLLVSHRSQITLAHRDLTVEMVFSNIRKLPEISGHKSQERKALLISELLSHAKGKEARYIVRTVLGEMRIGVSIGIVRDAIAKAFEKKHEDVESAFDVLGDYGKVAELARSNRLSSDILIGSPIRVMLADRSPGMKEALDTFEHPALEVKLDGFRAQIHKTKDGIKIFSRRMDDVTKQFPEIAKLAKECISAKEAVVEGEILAVSKDGRPLPFQKLSRRIQRKYDIEKMVREIPVRIDLFDIIYLNGVSLMKEPLHKRWSALNDAIIKKDKVFGIIEHIETRELKEAEKFYKHALSLGEEGVIVKNLDAKYQPGKRVGYWLKVKPIMDPLDLVITGGIWGEGKRANWIGSLILSVLDSKTGKFISTGMMGSGLSEEQLSDITKRMRKIITGENGREVAVKPEIVVEVAYEEIQKSPTYPSGYALRFPRLLRFRDDEKTPEEADTLQTMEKLFASQRGRKIK